MGLLTPFPPDGEDACQLLLKDWYDRDRESRVSDATGRNLVEIVITTLHPDDYTETMNIAQEEIHNDTCPEISTVVKYMNTSIWRTPAIHNMRSDNGAIERWIAENDL